MSTNRLNKTMMLSGEDSIAFAMSLFMPSKEQQIANKKLFDELDETVSVECTENGFSVEVNELDLSLLEKNKGGDTE